MKSRFEPRNLALVLRAYTMVIDDLLPLRHCPVAAGNVARITAVHWHEMSVLGRSQDKVKSGSGRVRGVGNKLLISSLKLCPWFPRDVAVP